MPSSRRRSWRWSSSLEPVDDGCMYNTVGALCNSDDNTWGSPYLLLMQDLWTVWKVVELARLRFHATFVSLKWKLVKVSIFLN